MCFTGSVGLTSITLGNGAKFIAYAKANPGKVMFASSGVGTTLHMSGELFKAMAGIDMLHVPYRGLAAGGYADLMTGAVHVTFDNLPPSIELIRAGKLRALAVTSMTRSQALPELPTVFKPRFAGLLFSIPPISHHHSRAPAGAVIGDNPKESAPESAQKYGGTPLPPPSDG